jgi:hypothetical protein
MEYEVINGSAPDKPSVRLYFDRKTGLLTRLIRFADTPLGRNPTQIDYADYKAVDGVTIPMRWTLSRPNGRFTIQVSEVKSNAAIESPTAMGAEITAAIGLNSWAALAGSMERAHVAGLHLGQHQRDVVERELHMAAVHRVHDLARRAVGHVDHLRAGLDLE